MEASERWAPVANFPLYSVSELGRVRRDATGLVLKPSRQRQGYLSVKLYAGGQPKRVSVHRLVADAFIPAMPGRVFVNHIDGDKSNNAVLNLEWVTHSENIAHANRTGLMPVGERHRFAKLTENEVRFIRSSSLRHCELARMFGVAENTVYYARIGKNWRYLDVSR
jgi:hypothetical protein